MAAPYFPVDMSEMKSQRGFYNMEQSRVQLDGVTVEAMWLNHPQGCMGFRLETKDGVLVYATDNEPGNPKLDEELRKLRRRRCPDLRCAVPAGRIRSP